LISIAAVQFGIIIAGQIKAHVLPRKLQQLIDISPCCQLVYRWFYNPVKNVELYNQAMDRSELNNNNKFQDPLLADCAD